MLYIRVLQDKTGRIAVDRFRLIFLEIYTDRSDHTIRSDRSVYGRDLLIFRPTDQKSAVDPIDPQTYKRS